MSARNPECRACGLCVEAHTVCLWGEYNQNRDEKQPLVMIVGEAPGAKEDQRGRPFIGQSGQLIRTKLQQTGITNYYITNTVKCRPPDNRTPTPKEAKACKQYLDGEIREVKPDYIVALGALASKVVLKKAKITECHGQLVPLGKITGIPIYHPAFALRDPSKLPAIEHDLARLKRAMDGESFQDDFNYRVVHSDDDFKEFLIEFGAADEFSFDTETSGLFPHGPDAAIRCLGIGLSARAWVIPLDMPGSWLGGNRGRQIDALKRLKKVAHGKLAIAQNGKFDNHFLYRCYGIQFPLSFDTMLVHHLLDENQDHGLKYMARVELDCPEYDLSTKEKKGGMLDSPEHRERYWEYNARDCWNTLRLKWKFQPRLKKDQAMRRLTFHLVMPAARAMERIELRGLTLNLKKFERTGIQIAKDRDRILEKLTWLTKGKVKNWNSPAQVGNYLYQQLKLKSRVKTKTGADSTGEAAIVELRGKHPVVDKLIEYREKAKFHSTYIEGWREYINKDKLYFSYKLHGTVTGRYSSRLHSVPRDGTIRNLVDAPPGWSFGQADLSQAELRIAAEMSGDLELVACFRPGGQDVHWRTLMYMIGSGKTQEYTQQTLNTANELILGKRNEEITLSKAIEILADYGHETAISQWKGWKEARKKAKAINFGFIYGMYEKKFIENAKLKYDWDCTWEEAHDFRNAYFELYQGIPRWHERQKTLVKIDGYVTNLFGRKRRLPGINATDKLARMEAERQAINSPVQGTIGDWKAAAMIEIDETIPVDKLQIVGEHHDALLMIVRNGFEDEVLPKVRDVMRHPHLLDIFKIKMKVPMECEIEIGPWGAGKKWGNQ